MIRQQALIDSFETEQTIDALPKLIATKTEREKPARTLQYLGGELSEMVPATRVMLTRLNASLGLPEAQ